MNKRIRKKKGLSKIQVSECWSLDVTIAKFVVPRLYKYKEINTNSYPHNFESVEEWYKVIDKIIWSFEYIIRNDKNCIYVDICKNDAEKYKEGMLLFAKYLRDLWD